MPCSSVILQTHLTQHACLGGIPLMWCSVPTTFSAALPWTNTTAKWLPPCVWGLITHASTPTVPAAILLNGCAGRISGLQCTCNCGREANCIQLDWMWTLFTKRPMAAADRSLKSAKGKLCSLPQQTNPGYCSQLSWREEWLSYNRKAYIVHKGGIPGASGPGVRGYCTIRQHRNSST